MPTDEFKELKQRSLFSKLRRLFSTDVIVRNVGGKKLKVVDTDELAYATDRNTLRDRFNRIRTSAHNQYSRDFTLSYQAARIELFRDYDCVGPDTIIPLPDGTTPTIAELTEKYKDKPQERFLVFSYDHETDSIKLGKAYHPRKKEGGARKTWKVVFDNGQYVIGSAGHPFLMRNGEYKKLEDLSIGESVMPFYQKDFYNNGYRSIYNFSKGWQSEHVIVAEQFERPLNDNEVVHHKNFDKTNNLPSNLQIMTDSDHRAFHMHLNNDVIWSPENKQKTIEKIKSSNGYKNRKCHKWNGERAGKNNPFYGKSHSKKSNELRSESLKMAFSTRNQSGENNPKFRNDLSFDIIKVKAFEYYKQNGKLDVGGLCDFIGCDYSTVYNRLHSQKYHWIKFKNEVVSTLNHKIAKIEYVGEIEVYDVTVEKYQNFATDSCFVHNTMDMDPIISSALDIYADECLTQNELGDMLTIRSTNDNIKQILHNLFYDILNIEFNLWSWTRNLVKYGDFYLKMYVSPEFGVYMVEPISSYNVTRVENSDLNNKNYIKFQVNLPEGGKIEELENYQVAHFRLLSDSNFLPYGKCLAANSYVNTEFGSKRIDEINIGDSLWTFNIKDKNFELSTVVSKLSTGIKKTIKITSQHNEIECSEDHPILVYSDKQSTLEYKNAKDISMSDLLVLSSNKQIKSHRVSLNKTLLTSDNHSGWKNNLSNLPNEADAKFARFFGFMLGDGWLNNDINRVSFAAGIDNALNDKYSKYLEEYSQKEIKIIPSEINSGEKRYVNSKLLAEFLYVNGFKGDATTKRIPSWVFGMDELSKLEFIRGFVDADGSVFTDKWNVNRYSIELNNKKLVEDIKELLCGLNIKCSNVKSRREEGETEICGIKCHRNTSYYIYFYLDGNKKTQVKKYDLIKNENIILVPIVSISSENEQEMYDIQVASSNSNFIANGMVVHNCIIEGARRVWKQVSLMEDAMLIHRIMRAPEKRIYKVDIGNIPPNEVDQYMEKLINKTKKVPYIDEKTGDYNLRFNLWNMVEDIYLPVRGSDSGTSIEPLSGMEFTGIDDIEYLRNKMMAALKIPKAFLGYEEDLSGKATLAAEDVRFARTVQRVQKFIVSELTKIAIVHLYSQGYKDAELVDFSLELTNPSTIFEKEKVSVWQEKTSLAKDMIDAKIYSRKWIHATVFNTSEDDIDVINNDIVEDAKQAYRLKKIEEEGIDPAKPYNKINVGEEGAGGTTPEAGPTEPEKAPAETPVAGAGEAPPLKERDQTGRKKASNYPFGEDPLGGGENNRRSNKTTTKHPVSHAYKNNSPLSFEGLDMHLCGASKKSILSQHVDLKKKSFLDESNIIE